MEINKIYNEDCLEGMKRIPTGSVDAIICDPPYGTMKGFGKSVAEIGGHKHDWDIIIPTDELFKEYERILRRGGRIVLFSQEPYTSHLRTFSAKNIDFCYPMIWKKKTSGNILNAKRAPINFFEDINVFVKEHLPHDYDLAHPLRAYFSSVMDYIGATSFKKINERLGHRKAEHSFYVSPKKIIMEKIGGRADNTFRNGSSQFALCTAETYKELIDVFGIDKMEGFRTYEDLKKEDSEFLIVDEDQQIFNLPEGAAMMSNVLEFAKDAGGFHPTQKPLDLIRLLVRTYTNEGDTILDNCMGSGTTAIACIREKRNFIGFELNKEYFDKANERIAQELSEPNLF